MRFNTNPFPGMNPWLEQAWGDVHASFMTYARDSLQDQLPPDLQARVEEYLSVADGETDHLNDGSRRFISPDVAVTERTPSPDDDDSAADALHVSEEPIRVPLRSTDEDARLPLQWLINHVYERGRYGNDLDYARPPEPPLSKEDRLWVEPFLRQLAET